MTVSQEVDAFATMGIARCATWWRRPLLAMAVMLPVLVVFADAIAILGAAVLQRPFLNVTPAATSCRDVHPAAAGRPLPGPVQERGVCRVDHPHWLQHRFSVTGGAEAWAAPPTRAVVLSICYIIVADMIFSPASSTADAWPTARP